jgi:23S rRNA pseudouridine1911/1915/1917 synthase
MVRLTVESTEAGLRLDSFLARRLAAPSAAAARRLLATGVVRVDGQPGKKGQHLRPGQIVDVAAPAAVPGLPEATALALSILYLDEEVIAVDKPAGVPSHPLRAGEGPSAAGAIVARFPECAAASPDPREGGLVHRLDRGTTGVLLAARSRAAWTWLRQALSAHECSKTYLAEVVGRFPDCSPGEKDFVSPGPRPGRLEIAAPIGRTGRRGRRVKLAGGRQPLPALTRVNLVEERPATALVEARLAKGRTHQVRAHLAYLGIPVVGDTTYGEPEKTGATPAGLHLHAASVAFTHPRTQRRVVIEAPLPPWARRRS